MATSTLLASGDLDDDMDDRQTEDTVDDGASLFSDLVFEEVDDNDDSAYLGCTIHHPYAFEDPQEPHISTVDDSDEFMTSDSESDICGLSSDFDRGMATSSNTGYHSDQTSKRRRRSTGEVLPTRKSLRLGSEAPVEHPVVLRGGEGMRHDGREEDGQVTDAVAVV